MKTQVATEFYEAPSISLYPLETKPGVDEGNGNRNPSPAPNLYLRPISVLTGWGPASYQDSRLPSSLKDWLASKCALAIGAELYDEPVLLFET